MQEYKSTVTGKRQITIPIEVCRLLRLEKGNQVLFRIDEDKILFDVDRDFIECFICNAASNIGNNKCFVCDGEGKLNKSLITNKSKFIGELVINSIKHQVSISIKNNEIIENKAASNNDELNNKKPQIELKSDKYSQNELIIIQDKIQRYILEDGYE